MKKIGITQRLVKEEKYDEIRDALDIRWQKLLLSIDLIPIPMPLNVDLQLYKDLEINGIILTGGNDLNSLSPNNLSFLRDKYENQCLEYALSKSIPIYGICRGMQLIAEYFGSTFKKIENHVATRHRIVSPIRHKYQKQFEKINDVNSFHNYSINILGDKLETIVKLNVGLLPITTFPKLSVSGSASIASENKNVNGINRKKHRVSDNDNGSLFGSKSQGWIKHANVTRDDNDNDEKSCDVDVDVAIAGGNGDGDGDAGAGTTISDSSLVLM